MINLTAKLVQKPNFDSIIKQLNFGTSKGVNQTVTEGKAASIGAIKGKFQIRNNWLTNSPIGIKAKFSNKNQSPIVGEISTAARFLPLHEEGGIKLPYKNYLAVPADTGPLNKAKRIPERLKPKNLVNAFVLTTKSGTKLLCVRKSRGKNKGVVPYYVLIKRAKIKQVDIFREPIQKVVDRRLGKNISDGIEMAFKTAK